MLKLISYLTSLRVQKGGLPKIFTLAWFLSFRKDFFSVQETVEQSTTKHGLSAHQANTRNTHKDPLECIYKLCAFQGTLNAGDSTRQY